MNMCSYHYAILFCFLITLFQTISSETNSESPAKQMSISDITGLIEGKGNCSDVMNKIASTAIDEALKSSEYKKVEPMVEKLLGKEFISTKLDEIIEKAAGAICKIGKKNKSGSSAAESSTRKMSITDILGLFQGKGKCPDMLKKLMNTAVGIALKSTDYKKIEPMVEKLLGKDFVAKKLAGIIEKAAGGICKFGQKENTAKDEVLAKKPNCKIRQKA